MVSEIENAYACTLLCTYLFSSPLSFLVMFFAVLRMKMKVTDTVLFLLAYSEGHNHTHMAF